MASINTKSRHLVAAAIHFTIAALFSYVFYNRFWVWRHALAHVNTSIPTPDGSNVTSAGISWIIPVVIFASLGLIRIARYTASKHRPSKCV